MRIVSALALGALWFAEPSSSQPLSRWPASLARKQQVIMQGLPARYAAFKDGKPDSRAKLRRGARLFSAHCSSCHGSTGQGTGPSSYATDPVPADLGWLAHTPKSRSNPYMYWTIAEGGRAFTSDMPAFKGRLSRTEIWAITAYIRAGLPTSSE